MPRRLRPAAVREPRQPGVPLPDDGGRDPRAARPRCPTRSCSARAPAAPSPAWRATSRSATRRVRAVLVEPQGSIWGGGPAGPAQGRRASATRSGPATLDRSLIDEIVTVNDETSFAAVQGAGAQRGPARGRLRRARPPTRRARSRASSAPAGVVVTLFPDGFERYLARESSRTCEVIMGFATDCIHAGQEPDPDDRRDHHADLPDLDLRPGGHRQAQGLRVRAHPEPHAARAREEPRGARGRAPTPTASPRGWRPPRPCCRWSRRASGSSSPTTSTAAPTASSRRSSRRYGVEFAFLDASDAAAFDTSRRRLRSCSGSRRPPTR